MSLFEELKRRNVFRVAVAYIVAAWVLLQVADLFMNYVDAPDWVMHVLMFFIFAGFIVAMIVSWAYELTPQGIRRESEIDRSRSITHQTAARLDRITIGLLVTVVAVILVERFVLAPQPEAVAPVESAQAPAMEAKPDSDATGPAEKSIAVLPFRDMSPEGDQAYFAEGIAEELLNALTRLEGLQVASRTSTFKLAGEGLDIPSIAERLSVANILEGSVRTAGNRVRVTAQLIDVARDVHLWSETYDGTLDDIFQIQDEITAKITAALRVQLTGEAQHSPAEQSTGNAEAYQLFLQGRHLWRQRNAPALRQAVELLERAVSLDPGFHQAWASLALAYYVLPSYDRTADDDWAMAQSNEAADRVLELVPDQSEALTIKASNLELQCKSVEAVPLYEAAIASNPKDPTAWHWYALLERNAGRATAGLEHIMEARRIDPLISAVISSEGDLLAMLGRHEEAIERHREAVALGIRGGSRLREGLTLISMGRAEEGARLVRESTGELDPDQATTFLRFADAVLDPGQRVKFEQSLALANPDDPYQTADVSRLLALLGSPYLFEYLADISCPYLHDLIWSEPFREQRGTREFFELMERAGIVAYWREYGWPDDCASLDQELAECPQ